ncbi:hypothetical protein MAPG_06498 [Magnaporthiopsis poae ATCC 64411]|uniref:Uncharacterized protein n=1 Tax=Magnaporthiopsis poae (strain ATCC 64411 / 73-15) TaxID=644358 RepID=A0A0C4E269_MAGP6|nr:hypothetical protein MAPG_06498 [Magnaporthiopsis poae ATCC 64411]
MVNGYGQPQSSADIFAGQVAPSTVLGVLYKASTRSTASAFTARGQVAPYRRGGGPSRGDTWLVPVVRDVTGTLPGWLN